MIKTSNSLRLKDFEALKIEKDVANIEEILKFCGIKEEDIEQELIFHNEGDTFLINGTHDSYHYQESYIIKDETGIFLVMPETFNRLFSV